MKSFFKLFSVKLSRLKASFIFKLSKKSAWRQIFVAKSACNTQIWYTYQFHTAFLIVCPNDRHFSPLTKAFAPSKAPSFEMWSFFAHSANLDACSLEIFLPLPGPNRKDCGKCWTPNYIDFHDHHSALPKVIVFLELSNSSYLALPWLQYYERITYHYNNTIIMPIELIPLMLTKKLLWGSRRFYVGYKSNKFCELL